MLSYIGLLASLSLIYFGLYDIYKKQDTEIIYNEKRIGAIILTSGTFSALVFIVVLVIN